MIDSKGYYHVNFCCTLIIPYFLPVLHCCGKTIGKNTIRNRFFPSHSMQCSVHESLIGNPFSKTFSSDKLIHALFYDDAGALSWFSITCWSSIFYKSTVIKWNLGIHMTILGDRPLVKSARQI